MNSLLMKAVSFSYDSSNIKIIDNFNASFSKGWTGLIGPNGCGKSTLMKLLAGILEAREGSISSAQDLISYCEQETLHAPKNWKEFKLAKDKLALELKKSLSLEQLNVSHWSNLSCGEQKRYQMGSALWTNPDIFLVDEPTNHLDTKNRNYILDTLKKFKGIGVIISHDRELLEELCTQCIFFVEGKTYSFNGSYSNAKKSLEDQFQHSQDLKTHAQKKKNQLQKEVQRLKQEDSNKQLSKSAVHKNDSDAKNRINLAKLTGKDASFGQKKVNLENRINKLDHESKLHHMQKDYSGSIFFNTENKHSKVLLFKESGLLTLPSLQNLHFPELLLKTSEKIAIIGDNGVGKSSLIQYLLKDLRTKNYFYLQQELDEHHTKNLRLELKSLNNLDFAKVLQIVARLGSDAKQLLTSSSWSSGETRKIAIALSIVNGVELLILDEPTNHLDLNSIENLEEALSSSNLALLIISHDRNFIQTVCSQVWEISKSNNESTLNVL